MLIRGGSSINVSKLSVELPDVLTLGLCVQMDGPDTGSV